MFDKITNHSTETLATLIREAIALMKRRGASKLVKEICAAEIGEIDLEDALRGKPDIAPETHALIHAT